MIPGRGRQEGSKWVRSPFPGNVIPREKINETALQLIKYFPMPNTSTPGVNYSTSNYFVSGGDATARDEFYNLVTKIDQNISSKHRMYVRYGQNDPFRTFLERVLESIESVALIVVKQDMIVVSGSLTWVPSLRQEFSYLD